MRLQPAGRSIAVAFALSFVVLSTMAHVGSPDTFFVGTAGAYPVRVIVRLPGVIPGRAQVTVRVTDEAAARAVSRVSVRAAQWNLGIEGAPPPDAAAPVPGDPAVYSAELWFMTATSYRLLVDVDGAQGQGTVIVPVLALATAERTMNRALGITLAALGVFLGVGFLTIVGAAVRESVVAPGAAPDPKRRRRARASRWSPPASRSSSCYGAAARGGPRKRTSIATGSCSDRSRRRRPCTTKAAAAC